MRGVWFSINLAQPLFNIDNKVLQSEVPYHHVALKKMNGDEAKK